MTKIIVVSDSHGDVRGIESLRSLFLENDYLIHLGDGANDTKPLRMEQPEKVYACCGNNDPFCLYPDEDELDIEGVKIFFCHGHKYGVKSGLGNLAKAAKKRGAQIALYGHTHEAKITEIDGVTLINPGAFWGTLQNGAAYCYLVIHNGKATPVLVGESVY